MNRFGRLAMRLGGLAALALVAGGCGDDGGGEHAPQITSHPSDQTVDEGGTATFTVAATGSGTLTYQWKKDGVDVVGGTGGTTPSYTTPPTTLADSGAQFTCVVTNAVGSATSNAATLTVNMAPPQITSHPSDQTVDEGGTATFTVAATGSGTLTYQWKKDGVDVVGGTGGTTPSYTTPPTTLADSGAQFTCVVTNAVGSATSNPATLTVRRPMAVAAGGEHSLALKTDGTVWAWGRNEYGQLGDGTRTDRFTPVQVKGPGGSDWLTDVQAVAAGGYHSLALKTDGTVWAWGRNNGGQLGDGTTTDRLTPVQVVGPGGSDWLTDVQAVAAGVGHSLALKTDGTVWAWGWNEFGQLGDGTTTNSSTPVQVVGPGGSGWLTDVQAVAAKWGHSLALKTDGTVWAWGGNWCGQLGDGTTTNSSTPVQVVGPGGSGWLTDVQAVAAGVEHSLALKTDGTVWAWGRNEYGQLGDGTTTDRYMPVQVKGPGGSDRLTDVKAVAARWDHSLALKTDGTVWAWGRNNSGQLGDGTTTDRLTPVQVVGPGGSGWFTDVQAVAAGLHHSLALKTDGTVWAWGANWYGQLGDGTTTDSSTPVQSGP